MPIKTALIVGAGEGISASFARALAAEGYRLALAARNAEKLARLADDLKAEAIACDCGDDAQVAALFARTDSLFGPLGVVLYNASARARGPFVDLVPADVERALRIGAYGGFLTAQHAARRMLTQGEGAIFFTGASASVKGYARSAPFAMAKFALRGLAQSLARELQPQNIHVAHFVIDGAVRQAGREGGDKPDSMLDPDAIAATYLATLKQHRSAWTWEVEMRPWTETF